MENAYNARRLEGVFASAWALPHVRTPVMPSFDEDDAPTTQRSRPASTGSERHGQPIGASETFWPASDTEEEDLGELDGSSTGPPLKRKMTSGSKSKYPTAFKAVLRKLARSFNKDYQLLPNDQRERDRNVTQHRLFTEMYGGKLYLAPLENPRRVLDLGCGPAAWTLDFARRHPDCDVLGIDLEPTKAIEKLPNCRFEVRDFSMPWNFGVKFDLIYLRMLGGLPSLKLLKRIHTNLEPGGWAEFAEWNQILYNSNRSDEGTALETWNRYYCLAFKHLCHPKYPLQYKGMLQQAGFSEIYERKHACPVNKWPASKSLQRQGEMASESLVGLMDALTGPLFGGVLGWPADKVEEILAQAKKQAVNPEVHSFMTLVTVYARKAPSKPESLGLAESDAKLAQA